MARPQCDTPLVCKALPASFLSLTAHLPEQDVSSAAAAQTHLDATHTHFWVPLMHFLGLQWTPRCPHLSARYAFRVGRNLPDKEFRDLLRKS